MIRALLIITALLFSGYAFSNEAKLDEKAYINIENIIPCNGWTRLDYNVANGYACSFTGYRTSVADGNDVVRAIRDLEDQIQQLNAKLLDMQRVIDSLQNQ